MDVLQLKKEVASYRLVFSDDGGGDTVSRCTLGASGWG